MKSPLLLALLSTSVFADGTPPSSDARHILHQAETHMRELQRLNETDALLELQLKIAKKLVECRSTGYPCSGLEQTLMNPLSEEAHPTAAFELPRLVSTYQGRARLQLADGRHLEVQRGHQLGPWKVHRISVDGIQLQSTTGESLHLPIEMTLP